MLSISPQTKVFLCLENVDFRKGIDGLKAVCRQVIDQDPFSGMVFVFRNRKKHSIRLLMYDGQGFWMCTKRLSQGKFHWWPPKKSVQGIEIQAWDLQTLMWNGNPERAEFSDSWRKVS